MLAMRPMHLTEESRRTRGGYWSSVLDLTRQSARNQTNSLSESTATRQDRFGFRLPMYVMDSRAWSGA